MGFAVGVMKCYQARITVVTSGLVTVPLYFRPYTNLCLYLPSCPTNPGDILCRWFLHNCIEHCEFCGSWFNESSNVLEII